MAHSGTEWSVASHLRLCVGLDWLQWSTTSIRSTETSTPRANKSDRGRRCQHSHSLFSLQPSVPHSIICSHLNSCFSPVSSCQNKESADDLIAEVTKCKAELKTKEEELSK